MKKTVFTVVRMCVNAMLIALYLVLATMAIQVGGLKFTFEHFPVVLCAVIFGPVDAILVGGIGEFINQATSQYGLTITTALWILPILVRGLLVGICSKPLKRELAKKISNKAKVPILFFVVCIISGVVASLFNTMAYYIDSKLFDYYNPVLVFGALPGRVLTSIITSVAFCVIIIPVVYALNKAKLIHLSEKKKRMTGEEAIDYIHSMTWNRKATGYEHAKALLEKMGNPERKLKFVHIGGTNGKGSTAAMMASILQKAGYKTGLYTSPYIYRFHERIQINGEQIHDAQLAEVTEYVKQFADGMPDCPSEFALVCCIAFEYFARQKCDIVVLEVGMGGANDSTNVIECPEVSVLTNIGLDHTEYLGNTLEEIATTKAGILKENGTAVFYRSTPSVEAILREICEERNIKYEFADFEAVNLKERSLEGQLFDYKERTDLQLSLLGQHQLSNAAVVLTTADLLREKGWVISEEAIRSGLKSVKWPGRFDVISKEPLFIIDGGHNPQCIEALAQNLNEYLADRNVVAITGVLADKDYEEMYRPIFPYIAEFVCITPPSPRKLEAEKLAEHLEKAGAKATACNSIQEGIELALEKAGANGAVICFGSLYSIGEIQHTFEKVRLH